MKKVIEKPWGRYTVFVQNEACTVKILKINTQEQLSLQKHQNRSEYWYIVSGIVDVSINGETKRMYPTDGCYIEKNDLHRATAYTDCSILEISYGKFDENDIIRLEDDYGRVYTEE